MLALYEPKLLSWIFVWFLKVVSCSFWGCFLTIKDQICYIFDGNNINQTSATIIDDTCNVNTKQSIAKNNNPEDQKKYFTDNKGVCKLTFHHELDNLTAKPEDIHDNLR